MSHRILLLIVLVLAWSAVSAQPDMAHPTADVRLAGTIWLLSALDQGQVVSLTTPQGLFMIGHGTLMKRDPITLKEQGVIELFGPKTPWADERVANFEQGGVFLLERVRRLFYPNMTTSGPNLLIVIGEYFFRVDMETMTVKAVSIVDNPDPLGELARTVRPEGGEKTKFDSAYLFKPAQIEVSAKQLLLTHNSQVVSIRIDDGKVLGRMEMPAQLTARIFPAAKAGMAPPAANRPASNPIENTDFSTIGTALRYKEAEGNVWTVKEDGGAEYIITGQVANQFAAVQDPPLEGSRVIVLGTYHRQLPDHPVRFNGYLDGLAYTLLPVAAVH